MFATNAARPVQFDGISNRWNPILLLTKEMATAAASCPATHYNKNLLGTNCVPQKLYAKNHDFSSAKKVSDFPTNVTNNFSGKTGKKDQ